MNEGSFEVLKLLRCVCCGAGQKGTQDSGGGSRCSGAERDPTIALNTKSKIKAIIAPT